MGAKKSTQTFLYNVQKGLEVCYCLWGVHPDPRLGPILGPSRSHPGSEVVPSRFAMCFVLQCFGPIQVQRWGPSQPVLVPSCSRAFLTASGLDGQKQTSWSLPIRRPFRSWKSAPKITQKVRFPAAPGGGEKLFDPWASGRKGQECPREIRTNKFMFMLSFLF